MTAPLTDADIAEARRLCAAATPGPWKKCGASDDCPCKLLWSEVTDSVLFCVGIDQMRLSEDNTGTQQDLAFVAAARTGWPAALDEIEKLRTLLYQANADHLDKFMRLAAMTAARDEACVRWRETEAALASAGSPDVEIPITYRVLDPAWARLRAVGEEMP